MLCVGIDVSKEKSTVCAMRPYGEIIIEPFDIPHKDKELSELAKMLRLLDREVRIVMESTGIYHLPIATFFKDESFFVSVINPYEMKQYRSQDLRKVKTDKKDAMVIAKFGLDKWEDLTRFDPQENVYAELRLLGRQYRFFMETRISHLLNLTHMLDYTMPGIKSLIYGWVERSGKDKLCDFVEEYWHFDNITKKSEKQFIASYQKWTKKRGYQPSETKASKVYHLAKEGIPTVPSNATTKMLMMESIKALREVENALYDILTRMKELAKTLPEYPVVRAMGGVGEVLSVKLIAEIGDVRKFHSGKALVAFAGIDPPPHNSGKFIGNQRHITKRGSSTLRKIGYEVMRCLKTMKRPQDPQVYDFILKKEAEGKPKRVAKIAALNKFLRIYYARVMEVYS